jgi:hypothetical protein
MKRLFIGITVGICLFTMCSCSRPENARRVLTMNGYTQIQTHGFSWYGCSQGDHFSTKFTAISPAGTPVEGVVCEGLPKGATVRIF